MSSETFTDLTLGPIDDSESYQRSGQFWEKAFRLSGPVPPGWAALFDEVWEGARYEPKRHARIENGFLMTICLVSELQGEHGDFLVAAVARTNAAFRAQLTASR